MSSNDYFEIISGVIGFYAILILGALLSMVANILAGVAIHYDAKAIGRENGTVFAVLTALFGGIPAMIYVGMRHKCQQLYTCPTCGMQYKCAAAAPCPRCGAQLVPAFVIDPVVREGYARTAKKCFGWALGLFIASYVVIAACLPLLASAVTDLIYRFA